MFVTPVCVSVQLYAILYWISLDEDQIHWRGYYEDDDISDSIKGGARMYFVCWLKALGPVTCLRRLILEVLYESQKSLKRIEDDWRKG